MKIWISLLPNVNIVTLYIRSVPNLMTYLLRTYPRSVIIAFFYMMDTMISDSRTLSKLIFSQAPDSSALRRQEVSVLISRNVGISYHAQLKGFATQVEFGSIFPVFNTWIIPWPSKNTCGAFNKIEISQVKIRASWLGKLFYESFLVQEQWEYYLSGLGFQNWVHIFLIFGVVG